MSNGTQDTDVPFFDNTSVCLELSDENIETFVSVVETAYKNSFEHQYIGFSVVGDSLVERKYLRAMYNSLVDLFPFVHSVLAMTVYRSTGAALSSTEAALAQAMTALTLATEVLTSMAVGRTLTARGTSLSARVYGFPQYTWHNW